MAPSVSVCAYFGNVKCVELPFKLQICYTEKKRALANAWAVNKGKLLQQKEKFKKVNEKYKKVQQKLHNIENTDKSTEKIQ